MSDNENDPVGTYMIFIDAVVDTVTNKEVPEGTFSDENVMGMFNSAPSIELESKREKATHVVHTKMGYDIFFHIGIG